MTPADPSLLAQLRQLPSPWHSEMITGDASTDKAEWGCWCEWCKVDIKASSTFFNEQLPAHPANGCLWYIAHAAILEAQPPETQEPNFIVRGPYVLGGWERRVGDAELLDTVLDAAHMSPLGEATVIPLVPKHLRQPPETAQTPLLDRVEREIAVGHYSVIRSWLAIHGGASARIVLEEITQLVRTLAPAAPDPPAPVSAEADIIADQEARLDAAYLCGDCLPIANAATQEVTYAVCVLDKGHGGADHVSAAGIHRWPQRQPPAETPTPRYAADDCGQSDPCRMPGHCAWHAKHPTPADTPPGLAPLLEMSKQDVVIVAMQANRADIPEATRIALKVCIDEICAQRQASASVRREPIEAVKAIIEGVRDRLVTGVPVSENVARWVAGVESALNSVVRVIDEREAARVSPRPPSGWGQ